MSNKNLRNAKKAKNDEFYTLYSDIEKEMQYYDFSGKVVYCNCDDYRKSNFVKFFKNNFKNLKLKKLIASCYIENGKGLLYYYDLSNGTTIELMGDGSYNSDECIEVLKQADIIISNPPFSKFRDYFSTLMQYNKKFIILGNQNAVTTKEIFPYIKNGQLWVGHKKMGGKYTFIVPDTYNSKSCWFENGIKYASVNSAIWFTNIKYNKQISELILTKTYNEKDYPKYDNYDAINVDKVKDIPIDYDGYMGVPITAIQYLNNDGELEFSEEKFEIEDGIGRYSMTDEKYKEDGKYLTMIDGKPKYARIIIKKKFEVEGLMASNEITEYNMGYPYINGKRKYARIIIKSKTE